MKGIAKVPSYLIDMVLLKNKTLMIECEGITVIRLTKETIDDRIFFTESREYEGRLYQEAIKYHLVHIDTTKETDCKEIAK